MKKNCHNCKRGYWDNDSCGEYQESDYFVCAKRDKTGDDTKLCDNLSRPEYLEKAKRCCEFKGKQI